MPRTIPVQPLYVAAAALLAAAMPVRAQVRPIQGDPALRAERPDYFDKPVADHEFQLSMDEDTARRVATLIAQLAHPDFAAREQAQEALIEIGAAAMSRLRDAYHAAEDLETRLRIEQVAHSAYVNHHVLDKHGFLGISMRQYDPADKTVKQLIIGNGPQRSAVPPPVLPEGRVCVFVANVIDGTGAQRAGVQPGDAIIALNGIPVDGNGLAIRNDFSALIRKHKPGETVELTIVRGAETLTLTPTLTRAPQESLGNVIVINELYREASERFQIWWDKFFLHTPADSDSRS